ncbi:hypothetical protein RDI58_023455 [Solanum bulbocastanum]|uniref:Terpene synthase metal-binding domain-containing protein n=1 Tax=Solanum bulbocastanum TaxID=147425 RepID=A0AAN8Y755_SOLBU
MDFISSYMRPLYQVLLDYFDEMEEELTKDGKAHYVYANIEMNKWIKSYLKKEEWLQDDIIPKCEEYKRNATITVSNQMILITCLIVAGKFISKETFEWMMNKSLIAPASSLINRLKDEIIGHEHEQQREHGASFIECYLKEYRASKQEAYAEARRQLDINMNNKENMELHSLNVTGKNIELQNKRYMLRLGGKCKCMERYKQ